jgi:hypothetical protein
MMQVPVLGTFLAAILFFIAFFNNDCIIVEARFGSSFLSSSSSAKKTWTGGASHPHRGVLAPYKSGPFTSFSIGKNEEKALSQGSLVVKQEEKSGGAQGGRAIAIQDMCASPESVWSQILDFNSYVGKVPKIKECKNYLDEVSRDKKSRRIKTKMVVGVLPGYKLVYYIDHTYRAKDKSITWSLDYDRKSDFDDVQGHWHVEEHPTKGPGWSRVFYAADLKLYGGMPKPVMKIVSNLALKEATRWVKRESEKVEMMKKKK